MKDAAAAFVDKVFVEPVLSNTSCSVCGSVTAFLLPLSLRLILAPASAMGGNREHGSLSRCCLGSMCHASRSALSMGQRDSHLHKCRGILLLSGKAFAGSQSLRLKPCAALRSGLPGSELISKW